MKAHQVALAGFFALATLVAGAPEDRILPAYIPYNNTLTHSYRCHGLKISECDFTGGCSIVETCVFKCINLGDFAGATCATKDLFEKNTDVATGAAQGCGNSSKKCTKCTSNKRGVLTCRYGFCYVVPGEWCSNGTSCHDECVCCKKPRIGKREVALECTPGQYRCYSKWLAVLQVCNSQGRWESDSFCGSTEGRSCCRSPSAGIAFCDCR